MNNTNKVPRDGGAVNRTNAFRPRPGANVPPASAAVASIPEVRRQQQADKEAEWLKEHRTDARTNREKAPSIPHIYAQQAMRSGTWACLSNAGEGEVIYRWNDVCWTAISDSDGDAIAAKWIETHAPQAAGAKQSEGCWSWTRKRLRLEKKLPALDVRRSIVPCADAYIEILPTGYVVLQPDPLLGLTHSVKVKCGRPPGTVYVPSPLPPQSQFGRFLHHAFDNPEVLALVQEHCGMTLLPRSYSRAAWWHGAAGSGKSTLAEIVEAMQGQVARLNLETLGDAFSLEPLVGANLILVDEVECEHWAEGRFKTLVSGNGTGVNRKHQKQLASYRSLAKWIITSNSEPFIRDKTNGVWRRLDIVHWKNPVAAEKMNHSLVEDILATEGRLVLDWMLEGARRIVARGRVLSDSEHPEEVRMAKREARHNSDQVMAWVDAEQVSRRADCWMSAKEVYQRYRTFQEKRGMQAFEILTPRQFWKGMKSAGLVAGPASNRRINGMQVECREIHIGGRLLDEAPSVAEQLAATPY